MPKSQTFIQGALIVGLVILVIIIIAGGPFYYEEYYGDLRLFVAGYSLLLMGSIFCLGASSYNMHILRKAE